MKNNFIKYLFLFIVFFTNTPLISDEIIFETEEINITKEGQITEARNGKVNFIQENFEVNGDTFIYNKKTKKLIVTNGKSILNNDNLIIEAKEIVYNRNTFEIMAKSDVKLKDLLNKSTISSEELIYNLLLQIVLLSHALSWLKLLNLYDMKSKHSPAYLILAICHS